MNATERIGSYRAVRKLGAGGACEVLLAKSKGPDGTERSFVLKILLEKYARDERFAELFAREATAYGGLAHPRIVQLHAVLSLDSRLVLVLEHVDGAPLSRVRGMLEAVGQQIDDAAAFHIAAEIFSALAEAHTAKDGTGAPRPIVHRYLSPSNVLIAWDGAIKVGDFALPKPTNANVEHGAGIAKGTNGYMAPEQVTGEATARSDVYAAGIILWELLTRRPAFEPTKRQVEMWRAMAQPRIEPLDSIRPDLDARVRGVVRRALEPRVEQRSITANEIVAALRELVTVEDGRERVAGLMAMVRDEPSPRVADVASTTSTMQAHGPRRGDGIGGLATVPAIDMGHPASPAQTMPAPAHFQAEAVTQTSGATVLATEAVASEQPSELKRTSSAKIPAVRPSASTDPSAPKPMPSGKVLAVKPSAEPSGPKRTPSRKMVAVRPASSAEPSGPKRTSSDKMVAVKPATSAEPSGPKRTSSDKMVAVRPATSAEPSGPKRTSSDKMVAVRPASSAEPSGPKRTSNPKRRTVTPALSAERPPLVRRSSTKMPAVQPPPLPTTATKNVPPPPPAAANAERPLPDAAASITSQSAEDVSQSAGAAIESMPAVRPSEPSSFEGLPKVLVVDFEQTEGSRRDDSEHWQPAITTASPELELANELGATAAEPPATDAGASAKLSNEVGASAVERLSAKLGSSAEPSRVDVDATVTEPRRDEAAAAPTAADTFDDATGTVSVGERPSTPSVAAPPRRRGLFRSFVLTAALAVGGLVAADRLGYVRLPLRELVDARVRTWLRAPDSTPRALQSEAAQPAPAATGPEPTSEVAPDASSAPSPPAPTSEPNEAAASATASAQPAASASTAPAIPSDMGLLKTTELTGGRRIFVDDLTVGQTPDSVLVKCGSRTVRIGSSGRRQTVDVPCGGEIGLGH